IRTRLRSAVGISMTAIPSSDAVSSNITLMGHLFMVLGSAGMGAFAEHGRLATQLEDAEQNLVPLRLKLVDGARSDLGMDAVDELLLQLRGHLRRAEGLLPSRHGTGKLLEEVLDAAFAAAEVIQHHVSHDGPTETRPPTQRGVDIRGAHDALG